MSLFVNYNKLLPQLTSICNNSAKVFNDSLQAALEDLNKAEEKILKGRANLKEKAPKDKNHKVTLQSINEDADEPKKVVESTNNENKVETGNDKPTEKENAKRRVSKKRSKDDMDGTTSPEQDKRLKRNASVKAQTQISKQVNVNLTQKLRREDSTEKLKSRRPKEDCKENYEPVPVVQIKQEKISLPVEPAPMSPVLQLEQVAVKQETNDDFNAMPPPNAPAPKSRKGQKEKEKEKEDNVTEESGRRRRTTRAKKLTDTTNITAEPSARATRASSRSSRRTTKVLSVEDTANVAEIMPPPEPRPKRTRAKKKLSDPPAPAPEMDVKDNGSSSISSEVETAAVSSPTEKPRPKRTRRGKNADKEEIPKQEETPKQEEKLAEPEKISPKEERISEPQEQIKSPVLQKPKYNKKGKNIDKKTAKSKIDKTPSEDKDETAISVSGSNTNTLMNDTDAVDAAEARVKPVPNATQVTLTEKLNVIVTLDKTVVLSNGVYDHPPVTPQDNVNETVVLEVCNQTVVIEKHAINDATMIIDKEPLASNLTEDDSIMTDDSDAEVRTPPHSAPIPQPTSAVKEKVQQFEELAARTTRTKTRAMAKLEDPDNHTPPDKIIKPVLSQDTLNKMNNMIFNGKAQQTSTSAIKPRANLPAVTNKQTVSASKATSLARQREQAEESIKNEKEDARKKKEAMLEAKRELQRRKREEKMANAAAARSLAERERKLAMEAAAKDRAEKQIHADMGKINRYKEIERKKLELARKVAETEERRKAEELARQQRLAEEQRKAEAVRRKQLEEAELMKKESAMMAKEMEKRHKEYMEKQKLKLQSSGYTPLKTPGTPGYAAMEPVYMADGFQFLNSDEEDEPPKRPPPSWSTSKARRQALEIQSEIPSPHIDALFSVRTHSPDLRLLFPNIDRARLKRTSSAVWRTPEKLNCIPE